MTRSARRSGAKLRAMGCIYPTAALQAAIPTARCLILMTPDGQRTMNTYLGAGGEFSMDDLDETVIMASAVTYLEGYLFDPPAAQAAFAEAARMARAVGNKTALSLSDAFCVDRHRDSFRRLISQGVDILFANEAEVCSLYQRNDFAEAAQDAARDIPLAVPYAQRGGQRDFARRQAGGSYRCAGQGDRHHRRGRRLLPPASRPLTQRGESLHAAGTLGASCGHGDQPDGRPPARGGSAHVAG